MSETPAGAIRAFIAVRLSDEARRVVADLERLAGSPRGVRWVRRENLHVTLKFLGNVETKRIPALEESLRGLANILLPFEIRLGAPGAFPSLRRPRILWVGLEAGASELVSLAGQVEAAGRELGFQTEEREFNAHITIGRVKRPGDLGQMKRVLREAGELQAPPWMAAEFDLMQSDQTPDGSRYTQLTSFPLGG